MNREFFAGKKVLVMGLGRFGGGLDVARFACNAGAKVKVTDLAGAEKLQDSIKQLEQFGDFEYQFGSHKHSDFEQADIIIVNPAVPPDNEFVRTADKGGKFVTSQINIFFQLCPALIIGVTGANGKSTTAALAAHLLKSGLGRKGIKYSNLWLSGNIGNKPLLGIIEAISKNDLVVLELSSFQGQQLAQIKKAPKVALLTNLTPNHLDRHGCFDNYCRAKENIFKFQESDTDCPAVSIFNAEDKVAAEWFEKYKSDKGRTCIKFSADDVSKDVQQHYTLPGRANLSNLAAAMAIAKYFGLDDELIKNSLPDFQPLPHRLQFVAEIKGTRWYNDSIATTPQSAIAALEAFDQPKIIIAGGYDKNLSFIELGICISQKARAAVLIGCTAEKIADSIKACPENRTIVKFAESLEQAVEIADTLAIPGDVVLLSPACASYDMFDNFQHRGRQFSKLVNKIRR